MTTQSFRDTHEGALFQYNGRILRKSRVRARTKGTGGKVNAVDHYNGDEFWLEPHDTVVGWDEVQEVEDEVVEVVDDFQAEWLEDVDDVELDELDD